MIWNVSPLISQGGYLGESRIDRADQDNKTFEDISKMNYYSFKYFNHKIDIELPSIGETAIKVSICGALHYESVHLPWTSYELFAGDQPHLWIVEAFDSAVRLLAEKGFGYVPIAAESKPWLEEDDPGEPVKIPYSIWHRQDF